MRDLRRAPFCWQSCAATTVIRSHWTGKRRTTALALYQALTEIANEERADRFVHTQKLVAERAGVGVRTVREYVPGFEGLSLLRVRRRHGEAGGELAPEWELVDPPAANAAPPAVDDTERATPPAANADLVTSRSTSNDVRDRKDVQERSDAFGADVDRLCDLMAKLSNERAESKRFKVTTTWRREMDRLMRLDGRTAEQIEYVIKWVHADSFWGPNVLAVPKLRAQFDALVARIKASKNGNGKSVGPSSEDLRRRAAELRKDGR